MKMKPIQKNFRSGEVDKKLRAQTGSEVVSASVSNMTNMIPENHGVAEGRNGMETTPMDVSWLGELGEYGRIFTFNVSREESYLVVISPREEPVGANWDIVGEYDGIIPNNQARCQITVYNLVGTTPTSSLETFEVDYELVFELTEALYSVVPYLPDEIQDIHFMQIKDQMFFVHGSHPPMKLIRYRRDSDNAIRWAFTYVITWGAEWGDGYVGGAHLRSVNDVSVIKGFPRTIAYHQQRIVYGGMIDRPSTLVFSRVDDFSMIDSGIVLSAQRDYESYATTRFNDSQAVTRVVKVSGNIVDPSLIVVILDGTKLTYNTDYEVYNNKMPIADWSAWMQANEISLTAYFEFQDYYGTRFNAPPPDETYIYFPTAKDLTTSDLEIYATRPDDSAVVFDLASTTQDTIQWLASGQALFIGTTGGEWVAANSDYISATQPPVITKESTYGSSHVQPIQIGDSLIHVTASGRELRALRSDYTTNREKWVSVELSWIATHLFKDYAIKEICYAQTPDNVLWVLTNDGKVYSAVYDPSMNQQAGWSRVEVEGEVRNIASIANALEDRMAWAIRRTTAYYDEGILDTVVETNTTMELSTDSANMDAWSFYEDSTPQETIDLAQNVVLSYAAERYATDFSQQVRVCIMGDGGVDFIGTYDELVATGRLTGTVYTMQTAARFIETGIPFTQSLSLTDFDYGSDGSLYAEKKKHTKVWLDLIDSQPPMVNGNRPSDRSVATLMGNIEAPIDGKTKVYSVGYDVNRDIAISQEYPFRLTIAAVFGVENVGSKS